MADVVGIAVKKENSPSGRKGSCRKVPAVQLVDCPDEDTWSRLLWDLNKPDPESKPSFTVLMRNSRDIERLKYAVLMKKTVELNTKSQVLQLSNFTRGRLLLMPTVKPRDVELIDGDVARSFFYSEQYYQALQNIMERDISAFRRVVEEKDHLKYCIHGHKIPALLRGHFVLEIL